jgi:hypothetical protein
VTNDLSDAALRAMAAEAEPMARLSPEDREYLPTLGPQTYRETGGYTAATEQAAPAKRAKVVADILTAGRKDSLMLAGARAARQPLLVLPPGGHANADVHRTDARRAVIDRRRQNQTRGA